LFKGNRLADSSLRDLVLTHYAEGYGARIGWRHQGSGEEERDFPRPPYEIK
jgi:hypothetical protein